MEYSDDESETLAQNVTNYHFVDDKDEPVSFSVLPIKWCEDEKPDSISKVVFLNGIADDGIQKIYKQVTDWKFELLDEQPVVSVLSKEKNWIKLLKPRKSFEDIVRSILITVHCLYLSKMHPDILGKPLWERLWKAFSSYEARPCENDLLDHLSLIRAAYKRDEALSKSKFLATFLETPPKRKVYDEDAHIGLDGKKSKFIVDDDEEVDEAPKAANEDNSDDEAELFDSVCAICDNGGELLCCEGRCIRSFHATVHDGEDSDCKSLGLSKAQVKAMQNFMCLNCQYKKHQCFACGKLGSSDKSSGAEVFHCVSATCGFFYHPQCVAKLLHPTDEAEAEELQKRISGGESFTCPAHKCHICKLGENKDITELQFAVCRRCPRAYHRKCLPGKIPFEDEEDEDIVARAWNGLLANDRVLIYCLKHKIDEDLGTPIRNHIIFPQDKKRKAVGDRRFVGLEDSPRERVASKVPKHLSSSDVKHSSVMKKDKLFSEKSKVLDISRKPFRDGMKIGKSSAVDKSRASSVEERFNSSEPFKSKERDLTSSKSHGITKSVHPRNKQTTILVDAETKKRIRTILEKTTSSITLQDVLKTHKVPSTHGYSSKAVVDKTITIGKVEGFVEAIRTALQKLEGGGSVEDAKAVCGPEIVNQVSKWKSKLKVYLAPFLHGMRYTSFGRHFTKVDKLQEIVDMLHWYTQSGDMIVDFCCGANDFSWLMKQKLEETGKRCSFKNFDLFQPKNDFCFEKRDWMTVRQKELPKGSNLIMGLNPPFGVKAALANKFIDKALEFKPKLVILIVPPETERLDRKRLAYDLIWEDSQQLSGKSFYLPGSVDVHDNQMDQWNLKAPVLYLWSHPDWTAKHKAISLKHGHFLKESDVEENHNDLHLLGKDNEVQISEDMEISPIRDYRGAVDQNKVTSEQKNEVQHDEVKRVDPRDQEEKNPSKRDIDDRNRDVQRNRRKKSEEKQEEHDRRKQSGTMDGKRTDRKSSVDRQPSEVLGGILSDRADNEDGFQRRKSGPGVTGSEYRTGSREIGTSISDTLDDIARRYSSEGIPLSSVAPNAQEYGMPSSDVQFSSYMNDSVGSYAQTSYPNELNDYRRETDTHQLVHRYGGPIGALRSPIDRLPVQDAAFGRVGSLSFAPYQLPGSASELSYGSLSSSAMHRYAPRLDELNPGRTSGYGSQLPQVGGIGSQYAAAPGSHPSMPGFAHGSPYPFPPRGSSGGWLNE